MSIGWEISEIVTKLDGSVKRRTLRQVRAATVEGQHYSVYVILLDPSVARYRRVRAVNPQRNPSMPCVYVGMTGLTPEERFANHQAGIKSSFVAHRFGIKLLPELYAHLNPMPYEAAIQMEVDLAEDIRKEGYTVTGGH
jgi:hypothetical protein